MRTALATALAAGALLAAAPAGAYPPHTCGRVTSDGGQYIVRTHGPSCSTALRGARAYLRRHHSIKGFRCRSYGSVEPAYCKSAKHRKRYFFATAA